MTLSGGQNFRVEPQKTSETGASKFVKPRSGPLTEQHDDYYVDDTSGLLVFTAAYHLKRGYCCKSGCRHCPFTQPDL
jgi:hypothetical protein